MAEYTAVLIERETFAVVGYPDIYELSITMRCANAPSEAHFKMRADDPQAATVEPCKHAIEIYRDSTLVWMAEITDPLIDGPDWIECTSKDAIWRFAYRDRLVTESVGTADQEYDGGLLSICEILFDASNAETYGWTGGLAHVVASNGPTRRIRYEAPKSLLSLAEDLLGSADDVWMYAVPDRDLATKRMQTIYFADSTPPRTDRPAARFEAGDGTLDNCTWRRTMGLPRNHIMASNGHGLSNVIQDTTSRDTYGTLAERITYVDVDGVDQLDAYATQRLQTTPPKAFEITPALPDTPPLLFADFNAGDTVHLFIRDGRVEESVTPLVIEATQTVDDATGAETLTNVVLEVH